MQLSCVRLLVGKYGEKLLKSDIDPRHIRSFPNRVGASIYSVAVMDSLVEMGEGKKELYHSLKRVGYDLRRKMLSNWTTCSATIRMRGIREGRGDREVPRDCNALWEFCSDHKEQLLAGHFGMGSGRKGKQDRSGDGQAAG